MRFFLLLDNLNILWACRLYWFLTADLFLTADVSPLSGSSAIQYILHMFLRINKAEEKHTN